MRLCLRLPMLMVLTVVSNFILYTASIEAAMARDIKIMGISPRGRHQWVISIDGQEHSGSDVQVKPGDRIEWHVAGGQHGLTFEEFVQAEQFLDLEQVQAFEPDAGAQ